MAKRKPRSDSIDAHLKRNNDANRVMPLPEGIELESREEEILWRQFTNARAHSDWRDIDLVLIHKMIMLEMQIRRHNKMIEQTNAIIQNKRGTMVENPLLRVVDTLQRQQLAIIRSLSLGVRADDAMAKNAGGPRADEGNRKINNSGTNVVDLLA